MTIREFDSWFLIWQGAKRLSDIEVVAVHLNCLAQSERIDACTDERDAFKFIDEVHSTSVKQFLAHEHVCGTPFVHLSITFPAGSVTDETDALVGEAMGELIEAVHERLNTLGIDVTQLWRDALWGKASGKMDSSDEETFRKLMKTVRDVPFDPNCDGTATPPKPPR